MIRFLPLLALCACSSVVPSTALRLASVDPLTADPGAIELALTLPPGLRVQPGTAVLEFGAVRGAERIGGSFALEERRGIYALTTADAARMRAVQAQIATWRTEGEAQGSLGVGLGACAVGNGPAPDAVGSVSIRLEAGGNFMPLIEQARIADLIGAAAMAGIEECGGAM
jgi:hypothetical protein